MKNSLLILFVIALLFSSCKTSPVSNFNSIKETIVSNNWVLQDENGDVTGTNGQNVTLKFAQDAGLQANGFAGCNQYFSSVLLTPDQIKFSQTGSTMKACPDIDGEKTFLDLLGQVDNYNVSGNELKLYQGKILLLNFRLK